MGLIPINSVSVRGKLKTQRLMKRMPSEDGDRDLSDAKQIPCFSSQENYKVFDHPEESSLHRPQIDA